MKLLMILVIFSLATVLHAATIQERAGDYSSFSYDVANPATGDFHSQKESRIDGFVLGEYSLIDPDGRKRIIEYSSDENGFKVRIRNESNV